MSPLISDGPSLLRAIEQDAITESQTGLLSMEMFWHLRNQWAEATFGDRTMRGPTGPLKHLKKEVDEAIAAHAKMIAEIDLNRQDKHAAQDRDAAADAFGEEIADLVFLVFDIAHRAGMNYTDLRQVLTKKLGKNRARKWGPASATEAVEHIRDGE